MEVNSFVVDKQEHVSMELLFFFLWLIKRCINKSISNILPFILNWCTRCIIESLMKCLIFFKSMCINELLAVMCVKSWAQPFWKYHLEINALSHFCLKYIKFINKLIYFLRELDLAYHSGWMQRNRWNKLGRE